MHLLKLENSALSISGKNVLAFSASLGGTSSASKGNSMLTGGLFNTLLRGTGWVALTTDGPPVVLNAAEAPTFADTDAIVAWSAHLQTQLVSSMKASALIGRGSGEAIAGRVQRSGLRDRAAVRGEQDPRRLGRLGRVFAQQDGGRGRRQRQSRTDQPVGRGLLREVDRPSIGVVARRGQAIFVDASCEKTSRSPLAVTVPIIRLHPAEADPVLLGERDAQRTAAGDGRGGDRHGQSRSARRGRGPPPTGSSTRRAVSRRMHATEAAAGESGDETGACAREPTDHGALSPHHRRKSDPTGALPLDADVINSGDD